MGIDYLLAKTLNKKFCVKGRFYKVGKSGSYFNCRSLAVINRMGNTSGNFDAIFILVNPGSCTTDDDITKINNVEDIRKIKLTPAKADQTQYQVMRLAELRQWGSMAIINLSDLRSGALNKFRQDLSLAEKSKYHTHSIFSKERKREYDELMNMNKGPVILGWGCNRVVKNLIDWSVIPKEKVGWAHDEFPYYYHPRQQTKDNQLKWLEILNQKAENYEKIKLSSI